MATSDGRRSPNPSAFQDGSRSPNLSTFQVEHVSRPPSAMANRSPQPEPTFDPELIYREHVSKLISAKTRPFTVSGRIPLDPSHLVLFFRSKGGITHSLDFPIDIDFGSPPALDVLIAACKHNHTPGFDTHLYESFCYPPNLPFTPSLEIANHPILDAIRNMLFPTLPTGHYLSVRRDKLDVILSGGRLAPQLRALRNDGRIATLSVTLPVRFRGGSLVIRDGEGNQERLDTAAPTTDLEWTAFLGECDYEVETVTKGCRMSISYSIFAKSFGATTLTPDPLFTPSHPFLDLLPPVLQMSRGRKIAFLLSHDYDIDPSISVAESLVPFLKGGDSILYHALKLYKLAPVLHWSAGGYIWPIDRPVEIFNDEPASPRGSGASPRMQQLPPMRGAFGTHHPPGMPGALPGRGSPIDTLRARVEESGAIPLAAAEVTLLTDWRAPENTAVGKARVHFVAEGMLEKLVVNVVLVAFVL
ncbi:hypothetical protein B0H16DRAFT_1317447 [Mycena metata]|uniref:Uncharacterized protein n=1 Tax=Mycena metata TaxID=1033252 RepID=A0AAD7IXI0_9AGAR|nr:hypothetical protein B0H16DRAFT_1317447 [Mycena metata]